MRLGEFYELQLRVAMSVQEAKETLGFKPSDEPSKDEIAKAYKNLAFKHHPDRGGDPSKMVELNVAKDVLEGKQRPSGPSGPSPSYHTQTYTTQRPDPPKPVHVSFQEAAQKANVPTDVEWKFKTDSGSGGYGDRSDTGFVVYGKSSTAHVFVAVYHLYDIGNMFEPKDIDMYEMWVQKVPVSQDLASVAPKIIRQLWDKFGRVKKYNAKVMLLKPGFKFVDLGRAATIPGGRSIPFKVALQEMGEDVPDRWKGKAQIDLELAEEIKYPDNHPKFKGHCYGCCRPVLVVNGKEYRLNDRASEAVHLNDIYKKIWGNLYWYCGSSKKRLNRVKNAKKVLTFFANLCEKYGEPKELVEALRAAADQVK